MLDPVLLILERDPPLARGAALLARRLAPEQHVRRERLLPGLAVVVDRERLVGVVGARERGDVRPLLDHVNDAVVGTRGS